MAKTTMAVALLLLMLIMIGCYVESVEGGERGGHASGSKHSSSTRSSKHKTHHRHHSSSSRHRDRVPMSSRHLKTNSSDSRDHLQEGLPAMALLFPMAILLVFLQASILCVIFLFPMAMIFVLLYELISWLFERNSVLMVQVALDGDTEKIEGDLDKISHPKSLTRRELQLLLSETAACLHRHSESCFSAYTNVNRKWWFMGDCLKRFDLTHDMERRKLFKLVDSSNCSERTRLKGATCSSNKYVVVTILVATIGGYKLPAIHSYVDLARALRSLTSIKCNCIEAAKVLWTSRDDIEDFPSLMRDVRL